MNALKIIFLLFFTVLSFSCSRIQNGIDKWGIYEIKLTGTTAGNPFKDIILSAVFTHSRKEIKVTGFYDGDGIYKIRFMPDETGQWIYKTQSNTSGLNGKTGRFTCVEPLPGNHGPVKVAATWHFEYADHTPYHQVGTTCYAWAHQGDSLEEITLRTLSEAPFNKLRMCIFPKDYVYNKNEPEFYVFERDQQGNNDFTRFNPDFFRHFEQRLRQMMELGIEADLILFHPYDRWGYAQMPDSVDEFYLKYVISRLSSFRNVWWSAANEFDFMADKTMDDWHRIFEIICNNDPYGRLRSVHNGAVIYNHEYPWITHASIQSTRFDNALAWREQYKKPVIFDECRYEGDIPQGWGNLTPEEMVSMFWKSLITGTYAGHGETYMHPLDILWWSKGGTLHGESPARIAFFKKILENAPDGGFEPFDKYSAGKYGEQYVYYFDTESPVSWTLDLPGERSYLVEVINTWDMTIDTLDKTYEGKFTVDLPGEKYIALRITFNKLIFPLVPVRLAYSGTYFYRETEAKLVHPDPGQVYYTVDGSEPTQISDKYTGPIKINKPTILKAAAIHGDRRSAILQAEYLPVRLNPAVKTQNLQNGLEYEYYTGVWDQLPDFSSFRAEKSGVTGAIDLSMAEDEDYFGIRYTGYMMIPEDNAYTFTSISDDGSFIFIDGKEIVSNDFIHGASPASGQVGLEAGYHKIEIHFFEKFGDQHLEVLFESDKLPKRQIGGDMLFHSD
jgi:hypothetical protein